LGGATTDEVIICNLPPHLADSAWTWLKHLPPSQIHNWVAPEGVAPEPLDVILLRVVLGDSHRLEFLWEEEVTKSRRESGEAVVVARRRSLLAP
jgi:hypothetical protein